MLLVLVAFTPFGCGDSGRSALPPDPPGTTVILVISDVTVIDYSLGRAECTDDAERQPAAQTVSESRSTRASTEPCVSPSAMLDADLTGAPRDVVRHA